MQKLIIITAPSGAGKSTIAHYLLNKHPQLSFSISCATREPRGTEQDGVDYYFVSVESFEQKIKEDAFLEWEMVYTGKYYGTLKSELQRIWDMGKTPILDIDVKGAVHVQKMLRKQVLSIFIEPPSIEELRKRLVGRNTDSLENIEIRLNKAAYEISFKGSFDLVVVNNNIDAACATTERAILSFLQE